MNKELIIFNGIFGTLGGMVATILGGWTLALQLLVMLIIIDYITGLMVGFIEKSLSSRTGFRGLFKKLVILMMVCIAAKFDSTLNTTFLRDVVVFFYVSNEGISVLENTAKLGVPYPPLLKEALIQIGKQSARKVEQNDKSS